MPVWLDVAVNKGVAVELGEAPALMVAVADVEGCIQLHTPRHELGEIVLHARFIVP